MKPKRTQIIDGIVQPVDGQHIRFENGQYATEDKKEIEYIRKHRLFGNAIFEDKKQEAPAAPAEVGTTAGTGE